MSDVKKFWDARSSKYDKLTKIKYEDAYNQTIELSKDYLKKGDVVFDFACGTGITTIPLAETVGHIDAIDISPKMIDVAKAKAVDEGVENINFSVGGIFDSSIGQGIYDVVMAFNILYFFEDINEVLKRIYSLLKPNGIFLSATDCMGKDKNVTNTVTNALNKVGFLPYTKKMDIKDLKSMITYAGFEITFEKNLFESPPNLYIAAKK